jgi:hypothetical protein
VSKPLFEVVTPAANAAARRLTTAARVRAALRVTTTADDMLIESIIDRASATAAGFCRLARDQLGAVPTFGAETLRATWYAATGSAYRGSRLVLPWRVPVTAVSSVVEAGTTLAANTDYRLLGGFLLQRLSDDTPCAWSTGKIVVVYAAGWALPDGVPAEIEGPLIEQAKLAYLGTDRDPGVRSEMVPDVHQVQFNVAGGDAIGRSGLLVALEDALAPFKDWSQG